MKKLILLSILILICNNTFAHKQHVHQYITIQGYKLLERTLQQRFQVLFDNLGSFEQNIGSEPWIEGKIVTGAWREDIEDVVFNYSNSNPPTMTGWSGAVGSAFSVLIKAINDNNEYYSSVTHFWDPDNSDVLASDITTQFHDPLSLAHYLTAGEPTTLTVPNSYQKMIKYGNGNFSFPVKLNVWGIPNSQGEPCANSRTILHLKYNSLQDLYKYDALYITKVVWLASGETTTYSIPRKLKQQDLSGENLTSLCKRITFEILGRMCHLLQDLSVPAHAHRDAHGNSDDGIRTDCYEGFFGYSFGWDYLSVHNTFGGFQNPINSSNPLHYLMYTTAQMADHFGSNGPYEGDGNNYFGGNALSEEIAYLNAQNVSSFGDPFGMTSPLTENHKTNILSKMMPQSISATAGLLYWFAIQVGLASTPLQPLTGVFVSGPSELYAGGNGNWYVQLGNGLEPFTYQWEIMYLEGVGYLQTYESVKAEKEKRDKEKKKDGDIIINALPSNSWVPVGTNSYTFSKPHNPYDLRDYKLRCTVTDGSGTTKISNEWFVDVISAPPPQYAISDSEGFKQEKYLEEVIENNSTPTDFSLGQNYPNPFNPSTKISYSLPEANFVTLKIYDMLGSEIAALVNESKAAGKYEVEFNSSKLSSGTYVYKLVAGNYQITRKMQLVK